MAQKEKTVQPSSEERNQTEPYQKTADLAKARINKQVEETAKANPSLQNTKVTSQQQVAANEAATEGEETRGEETRGEETHEDSRKSRKGSRS